jgi:hypothetical protein
MEVSGQLHAPRPLYSQKKSPWYPLDRRVGGPLDVTDGGICYVVFKHIEILIFSYINCHES